MSNGLLVINSGSSSIKFSVFALPEAGAGAELSLVCRGLLEALDGRAHFTAHDAQGRVILAGHPAGDRRYDHRTALQDLLEWVNASPDLPDITAVGHRVVHGGVEFSAPQRVTAVVLERLERLIPLAPLHQPHNLSAIRSLLEMAPDLPQVACFDTAFHRTQPELARLFALPRDYWEAGIQRYGFHGLSYEYIASVLPNWLEPTAGARVIVAHLGNGASLCALAHGASIATTMGFTALEGLPMGTRCGSLDPGVLLYLMAQRGMQLKELTELLYHKSGLLGLSGISNDMRQLLASTAPTARLAVEFFCYRIARELGSLTAALGGLDTLVFTGGIGEHAAPVREQVCLRSAWLGIVLDRQANQHQAGRISAPGSRVTVLVIPTNEELVIARHVQRLMPGG
ncbi:MAG: acetate/propionate family kinase [Candidatus Competibacteraceae bacterium]